MPHYQFRCDQNFKLIGNPEVRCGVNNYWLDEFPACAPTVTCPVPPNSQFSALVTVVPNYLKLMVYNGKEVAIPGSQVIYVCDQSENSTKVMVGDSVRECTDRGFWTGIQPYCMGNLNFSSC